MVFFGRQVKISALAKILYLVFLVATFFYVKSVLDTDSFRATEKTADKPVVKVKEAKVSLRVELSDGTREYTAKLTTGDSVKDLLYDLRKNQDLVYEVDLYTYGTEIVSVFDKQADDGKRWAVFDEDKDITTSMSDYPLTDGSNYTLKQIASVASAPLQ